MSRIGKQPIFIPKDVNVDFKKEYIIINGEKGTFIRKLSPYIFCFFDKKKQLLWVRIKSFTSQIQNVIKRK